ncbi:MAG: hypothetical protein M0D55_06740 [Elusimicrobiota bacterium]|nr:MAG: hypothetical protein M0D55_06740 [Elusimicrobiota bacterium]
MVRDFKLAGLLALSLLAVSSPAFADRRIVVFQPQTSPAQRVALAKASGGDVVRELPLINAVVIEHATQISMAESKLRALAEVKRVDLDPKINWLNMADARGVDFAAPSASGILKGIEALKKRPQAVPAVPPSGQETPWGSPASARPTPGRSRAARGSNSPSSTRAST